MGRGALDAIAAGGFGGSERGFRALDQALDGVGRVAGEAGGDADADGDVLVAAGCHRNFFTKHIGEVLGLMLRGGGQDDGEFLSAVAGAGVALADGVIEESGEVAEDFVAGGATAEIIDGPEVVDVDHEHGDGKFEALGKLPFLAEAFAEEAAIAKAGEGVGAVHLLEAAVGFAEAFLGFAQQGGQASSFICLGRRGGEDLGAEERSAHGGTLQDSAKCGAEAGYSVVISLCKPGWHRLRKIEACAARSG